MRLAGDEKARIAVLAFKYSENSYGHWVPLMLADRIGMIEGVVGDLAGGYVSILENFVFGEESAKSKRQAKKLAFGLGLDIKPFS